MLWSHKRQQIYKFLSCHNSGSSLSISPWPRISTVCASPPMTSCWHRAPRIALPSSGPFQTSPGWGCFGATDWVSGVSSSPLWTRCWPAPQPTAPSSCGGCRTSLASRYPNQQNKSKQTKRLHWNEMGISLSIILNGGGVSPSPIPWLSTTAYSTFLRHWSPHVS